jgi:hypothetical protein
MRYRIPEIVLGVLLTVAVLAIGATVSPNHPVGGDVNIDFRPLTIVLGIFTILLVIASLGTSHIFRAFFDGLSLASPLLTALATVVLAWLAYWQWNTLEKTDESNRQINRAFVVGKTVQINSSLPMSWWFNPVIENTGITRAQNVEAHIYFDFSGDLNDRDLEKRTRPVFTPPADPEELLKANVNPEFARWDRIPLLKSEYPLPGMGLTSKHVDELAQRRADGYVSGVITYEDVFKGSTRHKSKFCFVIQPIKRGTEPTIVTGGMCQFWNCVDEVECNYHKERYEEELRAINRARNGSASPANTN